MKRSKLILLSLCIASSLIAMEKRKLSIPDEAIKKAKEERSLEQKLIKNLTTILQDLNILFSFTEALERAPNFSSIIPLIKAGVNLDEKLKKVIPPCILQREIPYLFILRVSGLRI